MLLNFCNYLQKQGILRHTVLLTMDERSSNIARKAGVPATWDRCLDGMLASVSFPRGLTS